MGKSCATLSAAECSGTIACTCLSNQDDGDCPFQDVDTIYHSQDSREFNLLDFSHLESR